MAVQKVLAMMIGVMESGRKIKMEDLLCDKQNHIYDIEDAILVFFTGFLIATVTLLPAVIIWDWVSGLLQAESASWQSILNSPFSSLLLCSSVGICLVIVTFIISHINDIRLYGRSM